MMSARSSLLFLTPMVFVSSTFGQTGLPEFVYDDVDQPTAAVMLDSPEYYDAGVAVDDDRTWVAWLEFVPEEGDRLLVGCREADGWTSKETIEVDATRIARPTLTLHADGRLGLTYEAMRDDQWDIFFRRHNDDGTWSPTQRVSHVGRIVIRHLAVFGAQASIRVATACPVVIGPTGWKHASVGMAPSGVGRPCRALLPILRKPVLHRLNG